MTGSADDDTARSWDPAELQAILLAAAAKANLFADGKPKKSNNVPTTDAGCWLSWLSHQSQLTTPGRRRLLKLLDFGITLRTTWRDRLSESSIGRRLYLSHVANFDSRHRLASIVSSRLGRGYRNVRDWPRLLDSGLAHFDRQKYRMLLVEGTAVSPILGTAIQASQFPTLICKLPKQPDGDRQRLIDWLVPFLTEEAPGDLREVMLVSPAPPVSVDPHSESASTTIEPPLRDLISVLFPDSVLCLHLRSGGNLQRLLSDRLQRDSRVESDDPESCRTTYVILSSKPEPNVERLVASGATGWYVPPQSPTFHAALNRCRSGRAGQSIAMNAQQFLRQSREAQSFLVHCTRAMTGPSPNESSDAHRRRLWHAGLSTEHPLEALAQIAATDVLRSSDTLFRPAGGKYETSAVSFSAASLAELLQRRKYQSHLGRWDWEPYGVLVRRSALEGIGARPVIYGDESTWAELPQDQQPFFQAEGKSSAWRKEQEWRVLSDVRLNAFSTSDICLFVHSQQQAQALCRLSHWPVLWVSELLEGRKRNS